MIEQLPVSRPIDLKGQAAIVTGAARGIGRGIALALAREGSDVSSGVLLWLNLLGINPFRDSFKTSHGGLGSGRRSPHDSSPWA